MRRYIFIILFFIVLVTPFVVQRVVTRGRGLEHEQRGLRDAVELVIVTPHNQDIRRTFARAFSDWHRERFGKPVRVTYLTPGGTNDIIRMLGDVYGLFRDPSGEMFPEDRVNVSIDMVWGGGDTIFERELKSFGALKPVNLPPGVLESAFPTPELNGVPLYEVTEEGRSPKWVGVVLSSFGIVYNPTMYQTLDIPPPQTWDDLARPELARLIALADPTRSGSAAVAYMMAIQRAMADAEAAFFQKHPELRDTPPDDLMEKDLEYQQALAAGWKRGMRTLLLIAANARYFTESGSQPCNDVGNGDAAAGVVIDFFGRVYQEQVGEHRIRYTAPRGATAINPDPIAILYGVRGERELVANRFLEFLLSPEGQRLWNLQSGYSPYVDRSLRRLPIRRDVYADPTGFADADVNPFQDAGGFNMRQDFMRLFSDTRPIWAAAWIDSRGALKEAYSTILRVEDPKLRRQLLFELSDLPIEMSDVAAQQAKRRELEQSQDPAREDPRLWMAKQRVGWARTFRHHYAAVAAKAP